MTLTTKTILPLGALTARPGHARCRGGSRTRRSSRRAQEVYAAQKCSTCHSIAGKGGKQSPLDGVGKKLSADDIRQWIVDPVEMTKKTNSTKKPPMPTKYGKLPAADLDALVAYMQSLK